MKRALLLCISLLLLILLVSCGGEVEPPDEEITPSAEIDVLKIGKADCIIINTGSNILMIDTGERENLSKIRFHMSEKGYDRIDTLIVTHYDKDHIGGAKEIIEQYGVKTVIETKFTSTSEEYLAYHQAIASTGATLNKLEENIRFNFDGCVFDILVPKRTKYSTAKDNNQSLVISMECGEKKLLFCGDALELRMAELVDDKIGHYDIVKLPHHGTYLKNYSMVLEELAPSYCVITDSAKNPADTELIDLLNQNEIPVYATRNGGISISINDNIITVKQ